MLTPDQEAAIASLVALVASDGSFVAPLAEYDGYANTLRDSALLLRKKT